MNESSGRLSVDFVATNG